MLIFRFGSHLPNSKVIKRVLKMKNTSPVGKLHVYVRLIEMIFETFRTVLVNVYIFAFCSYLDLRIDWAVANIMCDDSKIIDLVTFFDVPFPKLDTFMSSKLASTTPTHGTTNRGEEEALCEVSSSEESLGQSSCHLINVLIKPHEGVPSDHPFGITPKQMVRCSHYVVSCHINIGTTHTCTLPLHYQLRHIIMHCVYTCVYNVMYM